MTLFPHEEYLLFAKFQLFFHGVVSEIQRSKFCRFPTWLPHHVTSDVIIIIKTFYMSSCTYGANFVSIRQAVAEKTRKFCADKQTNKQTNGPKCNALSFGEGYNYLLLQNELCGCSTKRVAVALCKYQVALQCALCFKKDSFKFWG